MSDSVLRVAPSGQIVTSEQVWALDTSWITSFDEQGDVGETHSDDFPDMKGLEGLCGSPLVFDHDGAQCLLRHCATITIPRERAQALDGHEQLLDPLPPEICEAAEHVAMLSTGARRMRDTLDGAGWFPDGFVDDTIRVAVNTLVIGKAEDRIAELDAKIDAYRRAHPPKMSDYLTAALEENADV